MKTPDNPDVTKLAATPAALAPVSGSAESLAEKLTSELLRLGNPNCERIVLMSGKYPNDKPNGGMCRRALVDMFTEIIQQNDRTQP